MKKIAFKSIADLYAVIPKIECKGLCSGSCGPVPATEDEIRRIEMVSTERWGVTQDGTCRQLCAGRCTVYDRRPLLCRFWGVAEAMPCPWGCVPERVMTDAECRMLLIASEKIGGGYDRDRIAGMIDGIRGLER